MRLLVEVIPSPFLIIQQVVTLLQSLAQISKCPN